VNDNTNNRLKNFLVNGFQGLDVHAEPEEREIELDAEGIEETEDIEVPDGSEEIVHPQHADDGQMDSIETELIRIRYMLEDLVAREPVQPEPAELPDMSKYMTTREQAKAINATVAKLESSSSNKALTRAMEQISTMREDFFKLCEGMRAKIGEMDAETVLSSFEAYEVDMENILTDAGVYIGKFEFDRLNTLHQRIVGVVPTDDKEKDGTIAERLSNGYKLGDKVLVKERVDVYKFDPSIGAPDAEEGPGVETGFQTDSETTSETSCESVPTEPAEIAVPEDATEEKE